ncbi:MAG: hypothetical protein NXI10_02810 [bacterium]|nr:hypothetical protein [bacterium]
MKNWIYLCLVLAFTSCTGGKDDVDNNTDQIESEIIRSTITELVPYTSEIRLIVPAKGGEESSKLEAREEAFFIEHEQIEQNGEAYFILSNKLTVPIPGERYISEQGFSNSLLHFLFYTAKKRSVANSDIDRLHELNVRKENINTVNHNEINKPGCYGYIEYSRMKFSDNNTKAEFIFKYRLNHGMDITQLVTVNKHENNWQIVNREDLLVSYEPPDSSFEPTKIIDTLIAPKYNDSDFEITFEERENAIPFPRNTDIIVTVKQTAFDKNFLKFVEFDFSVNRSANDLNKLDLVKINDSTYKMNIDECYSENYVAFDVRIAPKRGYIYSDFLEASQYTRYVDHLSSASLKVWYGSVQQIDNSKCK